jgi:hypothetical protein
VKKCRYAVSGVGVENASAYPMPTPEIQSPYFSDEDITMEEADEMYNDDPTLSNMPMEEDFFDNVDETLVEIPGAPDTDDDAQGQDNPLNIDTHEDNDNDNDEFTDHSTDEERSGPLHKDATAARWSEDTIQTEAMSRLGICINTAARVLICIACASAIRPLELPGHLITSHPPMSTSTAFSQELANMYDLHVDLKSRPGFIITAIYGLDLVDGYLACDTCGHTCKSRDLMRRHMKAIFGCKTFREHLVQTFRPKSKQLYFGVNLDPKPREESANSASLNPLVYLKKKYAPIPFSDILIKSLKTPRDAHHFLALKKWDVYVEGRTGAEITQAVRE